MRKLAANLLAPNCSTLPGREWRGRLRHGDQQRVVTGRGGSVTSEPVILNKYDLYVIPPPCSTMPT